MYRDASFSARRILIVKTSSLGDIIQSFVVLNYLKKRFPDADIDWAVEERFSAIVAAHPLVSRTIPFNSKAWKRRSFKEYLRAASELRRFEYDCVFDLQGNCKSGAVTLLSKSRCKVGFARSCVREWPNLLATHRRFAVPSNINIRLQLLGLIRQFLGDQELSLVGFDGVRFKISEEENQKIAALFDVKEASGQERIMVCPGSKWSNKQLPLSTLAAFLEKIDRTSDATFFLIWGDTQERMLCEKLREQFFKNSLVVDRMELPVWQNLMNEMSVVIAFDSGGLHLAGTTSTPTFSIFGPTMPEIFKPIGSRHFSMRGECPYLRSFEKVCPLLRTCPTGACIRSLTAEAIFSRYSEWRCLVKSLFAEEEDQRSERYNDKN